MSDEMGAGRGRSRNDGEAGNAWGWNGLRGEDGVFRWTGVGKELGVTNGGRWFERCCCSSCCSVSIHGRRRSEEVTITANEGALRR